MALLGPEPIYVLHVVLDVAKTRLLQLLGLDSRCVFKGTDNDGDSIGDLVVFRALGVGIGINMTLRYNCMLASIFT